jgi:GT2 family glycosyltransferase/glycosyltransferase involved in cell wall biosynthesis
MKTCITTSHLYGMGGGAKSVFWIARGLRKYGPVTIFTRTVMPERVLAEMPTDMLYASWYPGCSAGYDIHVCVDHFRYDRPAAKRNIAYIFHPHRRNFPPDGYELWSVSAYTKAEIKSQWERDALVFYLPIESDFYAGHKLPRILHVSRFAAPTQYADKGHRQMIRAMRSLRLEDWELIMAGSIDPQQGGYLSSLMAEASGANVRFAANLTRKDLLDLFASSSIYWHMTGVGMPDIPGAQEHLGITTIEAMASGCVPVVRGTGGQPEIVSQSVNGILVDTAEDLIKKTGVLTNSLSTWAMLQQQAVGSGRAWMEGPWFYKQFDRLLGGEDMEAPKAPLPVMRYSPGDVDIIIPIHNTITLSQCLDRLPEGPRVIVVDNGSDSPVEHPRIDEYIRLDENLGFAGGNMAGFAKSDRPLVLALNDDCFAPENPIWLQSMLLTISQKKCAVVGAKLVYPDGRLQHAGTLFDFHRKDVGYHRLYGEPDDPNANLLRTVPAVTGACLLCKREFFDMRPDLYPGGNYEDAHLCLEAWRKGYEVWYQPAARLVHLEAMTKRAMGIDYILQNRKIFVDKWRSAFLDAEEMRSAREANA